MAKFVHFDLPVDDLGRAKEFYEKLFDWKFNHIPEMNYYLIETTGPDGSKGLGGGMGKRNGDQRIMNYIGVESVDEMVKKIIEHGGKAINPKLPVPGMGYMAICEDTEGNIFGLWEENKEAK